MIATIILLTLMVMGLGMGLAKHGEPKDGKNNFWVDLIVFIIQLVLYYYAGLFNNFK